MTRDTLFILKPNLVEAGRTFHCPDCTTVEGVLAFHPSVRQALDVRYVDFARPRPEVIELLGEANQGCPVLILNREHKLTSEVDVKVVNGRKIVDEPRDICLVFAQAYGASLPH
jgi:hypothetical protein